ncbi:MAG: hypothetical protein JOY61_02365, partial [Chloroflexi bacterium]|nr:hypothetical protein [Chloroflexota bacterium]
MATATGSLLACQVRRVTLSSGSDPGCQERVARVLEEELQRVQTPEMAEAVVEHVERLTAGQTEAQRAEAGAERPGSAAET